MAFLKWLFGRSSTKGWTVSENGNPMLVDGSTRITVFPQDRGWKFCIADVEDRTEPYFSEAYSSEQDAREEAIAYYREEPPRHQPLSASGAESRRERWEAHIRDRTKLIEEIRRFLSDNPDSGISALRKPEAKVASHIKQLEWQVAEYHRADVSPELIQVAKRQAQTLSELAREISARIEARQKQRPPRNAPVQDSQLTDELAGKVDKVIGLLAKEPVMDDERRERLSRRSMQVATKKMLDQGLTYGEASGAPDFLNQDEASFRAYMKEADQDLSWQCDTVADAFKGYLATGEVPAPHYPMRIAVLLHRARDFAREKQFLAAWCKHFPSGNGTTYAKIVERAKKCGAVPS
ncbi:hypothetical protein [Chelativorans sp. AA-79]|uniref:hypothetical protein n=1 Tax=Chelativorans sp. AA-79 TaxID=3028735 RepID=UPI0023F7B00E|nr:hypothetical protein [Chelativorans sp. AA-79]WEX12151.1 hypothetical protein PVE73_27060 [Chelativorans sp. AA-79]